MMVQSKKFGLSLFWVVLLAVVASTLGSPTASPTKFPTLSPTTSPTLSPTTSPTLSPTLSPTTSPTQSPTLSPTTSPTLSPTLSPTTSPTQSPTLSPTTSPTIFPAILVSTAGVSLKEGDNVNYNIKLRSVPLASVNVSLTPATPQAAAALSLSPQWVVFNSTNWMDTQQITVSAVENLYHSNQLSTFEVHHSAESSDAGYDSAPFYPDSSVQVNIYNDDEPGVSLSTSSLLLNEGGALNYTIQLLSQPSDDVTVTLVSSDSSIVQLSKTLYTFSTQNWNVAQQVQVSAVDDLIYNDATQYSFAIAHTASSVDTSYDNLPSSSFYPSQQVGVIVFENDSPAILLAQLGQSVVVEDGQTMSYTVRLGSKPRSNVVVTLSTADPSLLSYSPTTLTFTELNWDDTQTVVVSAPNEDIARETTPETVAIAHTITASGDAAYDGLSAPSLSLSRHDNDVASIIISRTSGALQEGSTTAFTYTVVLTSVPSNNVDVVATATSNGDLVNFITSNTLSFTPGNWNVPQPFQFSAVNNEIYAGTINQVVVDHSASSLDNLYDSTYRTTNTMDEVFIPVKTVTISIFDDDLPGAILSKSHITVAENGPNKTYELTLLSEPIDTVTVTLTVVPETTGVRVYPGTWEVLANAWSTPTQVTVWVENDDAVANDAEFSVVVMHQITGDAGDPAYHQLSDSSFYPSSNVSITALDDDSHGVLISDTTISVSEGGTGATYNLRLLTRPEGGVQVIATPSVSDLIQISPSEVWFSSTNWSTPVTVQVEAISDTQYHATTIVNLLHTTSSVQDSVYDSLGTNAFSPSNTVTVTRYDNDQVGVIFSEAGVTVTEGAANATYTAKLTAKPLGNVEMQVASSDINLVNTIPTVVTFTPSNWNVDHEITVVAVDDEVQSSVGGAVYSLAHTVSSGDDPEYHNLPAAGFTPSNFVVVTRYDDDAKVVLISSSALYITEGSSGSYTIVLGSSPATSTTVQVDVTIESPSDGASLLSLSPSSSFTFTEDNWEVPQVVTVVPTQDSVDRGEEFEVILGHSTTSADPDYDSANVQFEPSSSSVSITIYDDDFTCRRSCAAGRYATIIGTASVCETCPTSHYCTGACTAPVPCPKGTALDGQGATSADECIACFDGEYASTTGSRVCTPCPAGYSCADPTVNPVPCLAGSFSLLNSTVCESCADGFYNTQPAQPYCLACPEGHSCGDKTQEPVRCTTGEYADENKMNCIECPAGYSCATPAVSPQICNNGTYANSGWAYCITCPPGYECPLPSNAPLRCPYGTFASGSAMACTTCPTGRYTPSDGANYCTTCPDGHSCIDPADPPVPCSNGTISQGGACVNCDPGTYSGAEASTCEICPPGFSCLDPASPPIECTEGQYSHGGAAYCSTCPVGTRSSTDHTRCVACQDGYACPDPTGSPQVCGPGYWSNSATNNGTVLACSPCPAGSYCTGTGVPQPCQTGEYSGVAAESCLECPAGSSCLASNEQPELCRTGEYSPAGDSQCHACDAGYSCPSVDQPPAQCTNGTWSFENQTSCDLCMPGKHCPSPFTAQLECPSGSFSGYGAATCTPCPAGSYCASPSVDPEPCPTGTYSTGGRVECVDCPAGYSCIDSSQPPTSCSPGTFSILGQYDCTGCPPGYKCPDISSTLQIECVNGTYAEGNSASCTSCPVGKFCPDPTAAVESSCPDGTYSVGSQAECTVCPPGSQCDDPTGAIIIHCAPGTYSLGGTSHCEPCPAGKYCPYNDRLPTFDCPIGMYSLGSSIDCEYCPPGWACPSRDGSGNIACSPGYFAIGNSTNCDPCPAGFHCPSTDRYPTTLCPTGTYSPEADATCRNCAPGYACASPELAPVPCESGYYSLGNAQNCTVCTAGFQCSNPAIAPVQCLESSWSSEGETTCYACADGYLCEAGSTSGTPTGGKCPIGSYCQFGFQTVCPPGTYGTKEIGISELDACAPCPAGEFCSGGTSRQPCPSGYFCPEGTGGANDNPCPVGTFQPDTGKASVNDCIGCPSGHYCGGSTSPAICNPGHYCNNSTMSVATPCPAGTFSEEYGLTLESQCEICPVGHYCGTGTVTPTACDPGTYNPIEGAPSVANCQMCPPGFACPVSGMHTMTYPCAAGHYCDLGTERIDQKPCPAGTISDRNDTQHVDDCEPCQSGYYCEEGTGGTYGVRPFDCGVGHYCLPGSGPSIGMPNGRRPCRPGTYTEALNLQRGEDCTTCPRGFYCEGGLGRVGSASDTVGACQAGYYCPFETQRPDQFPCPSGTYSSNTSLYTIEQCTDCPKGHFCLEASTVPEPCPAGSYSNQENTQSEGPSSYPQCTTCPGGYYCPEGSIEPLPCMQGSYSSNEEESCHICEIGHYCASNTTSEYEMLTNMRCPAGLYCPAGVPVHPGDMHHECPSGHYCPEATLEPRNCPPGTFNEFDGKGLLADCLPCPAGKYCFEESTTPTGDCDPGRYCPESSFRSDPFECEGGTFRRDPGAESQDDCGECTIGYYCPRGTIEPQICGPGTYCPAGSDSPSLCAVGTFSAQSGLGRGEDCTPCTPGKYCEEKGLGAVSGNCLPGYYCSGGSHERAPDDPSIGGPCPAGGYCIAGSTTSAPCPAGTYSNQTHGEVPNDCGPCDPGFYCAGSRNPAPTAPCFPGYFCIGGATNGTQYRTSRGHYTESGAYQQIPCPSGTYQPSEGQGTCLPCPEGEYCEDIGMIDPPSCPVGMYCPLGTTIPRKCPPGTFSNQTRLVNETACALCLGGQFCGGFGLSVPTGECSAGYFCTRGASDPEPGPLFPDVGGICPVGYYCPKGTDNPLPCPAGTHNTREGAQKVEDCMPCPPTQFCNSTGLVHPTGHCAAGYYCNGTAINDRPYLTEPFGGRCQKGYYCPFGSSSPQKCPAGTYAAREGQSSCDPCPRGQFCDGADSTSYQPCPVGHYCPEGTGAVPLQCPPGTYNSRTNRESLEDCAACPAGKYCPAYGQSDAVLDCLAGYYCELASSNALGGNQFGLSEQPCPKGAYCPTGSSVPLPCPDGRFLNTTRNTEISDCILCTEGNYCSGTKLSDVTGPCSPGYYCKRGASQRMPDILEYNSTLSMYIGGSPCPSGSFCPEGSANPTPCSAGTYNPSMNITDGCRVCPAGYYCEEGSSSFQDSPCPTGYYCPPGTQHAFQLPCPQGTFNNRTMMQDLEDCICSPPGTYTPMSGSSFHGPECDEGYYCSGCSRTASPVDGVTGNKCTHGTFCPPGSATPVVCPSGHYCTGNSANVTGVCTAGYYCLQGSWTPTPRGQFNSEASIGDICPRGHYCPENSVDITECPKGTYTNSTGGRSVDDCNPCSPGYYCPDPGTSLPTLLCQEGFICPGGDSSPAIACLQGHHCPTGSIHHLPCVSGTYQNEFSSAECKPCPEGKYCVSGTQSAILPADCPAGFYCPLNTSSGTQFPCPEGTYSNRTQLAHKSECLLCPGGMYCDANGMSSPTGVCDPGYFCLSGSHTATPDALFPDTQYTYWGFIDRLRFSNSSVVGLLESNSTIAIQPQDLIGDQCPPGHYCGSGSRSPIPCPAGSYSPAFGLTFVWECHDCLPGYYCPRTGQHMVVDRCEAGFYCPGGDSISSVLCPSGHQCTGGNATPEPCPQGTYQSSEGQNHCEECLPGYTCDVGTEFPEQCPRGHYCPAGTRHGHEPRCEVGTFSNLTGLVDAADCELCQPGKYCATLGLTAPSGNCGAGHYCELGASSSFPSDGVSGGECSAGWVCTIGASAPVPESGNGYPCPPGHYCPRGTTTEIPCESGTYAPGEAFTTCLECPERYYCETGSSSPLECPEGKYCPPGSDAGEYCPGGTHGEGLVRLATSDECSPCPPGRYCSSGIIQGDTAAGYVCYGNCSTPNPDCDGLKDSCGMDFLENINSRMCPNGSICPPGYYCPIGTSEPILCANGTVRIDPGGQDASGCGSCQVGFVCTEGDPSPSPCPLGHYCPNGQPIPCPESTFLNIAGKGELSDCVPCDAGHLCSQTGIAYQEHFLCPAGSFCPPKSYNPIPCPAGTYRPNPGAKTMLDCTVCPEGYFCPLNLDADLIPNENSNCNTVGSVTPQLCPRGSFCPLGSGVPSLCPLGYQGNPTAIIRTNLDNSCTICPSGTYGAHPQRLECAMSEPGFVCEEGCKDPFPRGILKDNGFMCPTGHYCPEGSSVATPCDVGTYNPKRGEFNSTACLACSSGSYNELVGQSGCKPCSSSSTSEPGSVKCSCIGLHRAFQPYDGKCLCEPGYEFFSSESGFVSKATSDADGDEDCQPITYSRCPDGESLGSNGACVGEAERCASECAFTEYATGTLSTTTGVCECDGLPILESVCDESCQSQVTKASAKSLVPNQLTLSGGTVVNLNETSTISGKLSCTKEDIENRDGCSTVSCRISPGQGVICTYDLLEGLPSLSRKLNASLAGNEAAGNGSFPANRRRLENFGAKPYLVSGDETSVFELRLRLQDHFAGWKPWMDESRINRRELANSETSTGIAQPIVCIQRGDGMLFDVSESDQGVATYPVYKKDSLLNTNSNFDFGAFRRLAELARSNERGRLEIFAFTFSEAGTYVFAMSNNLDFETIITVQETGQRCPTEGLIVPKSASALGAIGAKKSDQILLEPDWALISGLLLGLLGTVVFVIGVLYYLRRSAWNDTGVAKKPKYRRDGKQLQVDKLAKKTTKADVRKSVVKTLTNGNNEVEGIQAADSKKSIFGGGFLSKKNRVVPESTRSGLNRQGTFNNLDLGRWDDDDFDARELVERLMHHHDSVKGRIQNQEGLIGELMERLAAETTELKEILSKAGTGSGSSSSETLEERLLAEQVLAIGEVEEDMAQAEVAIRREGRLEEEFIHSAKDLLNAVELEGKGLGEVAKQVLYDLTSSADREETRDSPLSLGIRTKAEAVAIKAHRLGEAYDSELKRKAKTMVVESNMKALGVPIAEALQKLKDQDGSITTMQVVSELEAFMDAVEPFPGIQMMEQEKFVRSYIKMWLDETDRAPEHVVMDLKLEYEYSLTDRLQQLKDSLDTLLKGMGPALEQLKIEREKTQNQSSAIQTLVKDRMHELKRAQELAVAKRLQMTPITSQGNLPHVSGGVGIQQSSIPELEEEELDDVEIEKRLNAVMHEQALLDLADDTPIAKVHEIEAQQLESELEREEAEELEKWNIRMEEEQARILQEEEEAKNERMLQLQAELEERDDLTEEDRQNMLNQLEADHSKLSSTLDLERRRQQEELKNRLAERKLRRRRNQNKRHKTEDREEKLIELQEKVESKLVAEHAFEIMAEENLASITALAMTEEEELKAEHEIEVQKFEMSAAQVALSALSKEVDSVDTAELEKEKEATRAKFQKQREEALRKLEEEQEVEQKKMEEMISERRKQMMQQSMQTELVDEQHQQLRKAYHELMDLDNTAREELERDVTKLEKGELNAIQKGLQQSLDSAAKIAVARNESPLEAVKQVFAEHKNNIQDVVNKFRQRREQKHHEILEDTKAKRIAATEDFVQAYIAQHQDIGVDQFEIDANVESIRRLCQRETEQDKRSLEAQLAERRLLDERRRLQQERELAKVEEEEAQELQRLSAAKEGNEAEAQIESLKKENAERLQGLTNSMEEEKKKRREAVLARAEKLKAKKLEEIKKRQEAEAEKIKKQLEDEASKIQDEIEESISEEWEGVVDKIEEDKQDAEDLKRLEEEHKAEMQRIRDEQEKERKVLQEQLEKEREELLKQRELEDEKERLRLIDEKKQEARRQEAQAKTEEEVKNIRETHEKEIENISAGIADKRKRQREKLRKRLEAKKSQEALQLRKRQLQEQKQREAELESSKAQVQSEASKKAERRAIEQALESGSIPEDRVAEAIEAVLSKRHDQETQSMVQRHYRERTDALKQSLEENFEAKRVGKVDLVAKLKRENASQETIDAALAKFETECEAKLSESEQNCLRELDERQGNEQVALRQQQMHEVHMAFKECASEKSLQLHQESQVKRLEEELEEFKLHMEKEKDARIKKKRAEKTKYEESLKSESEKAHAQMEEEHKSRVAEESRLGEEEFERQKNERMAEQREAQEKKLSEAVDDNQRNELRAEFEQDKQRLESTLSEERKHQLEELSSRLEQVRVKSKEEYDNSVQQKLEEYEMNAKKEEEIVQASVASALMRREKLVEAAKGAWKSESGDAFKPPPIVAAAIKWKRKSGVVGKEPEHPKARREARKRKMIEHMKSTATGQIGTVLEALAGGRTASFAQVAPVARMDAVQEQQLNSRLGNIEKLLTVLQTQQPGLLSGEAPKSTYTDASDMMFKREGALKEVPSSALEDQLKPRLEFGKRVVAKMGMSHLVSLEAAETLPDLAPGMENNAFRNSFHWDAENRVLYVRKARLENPGDLTVLLVHTLAHIKVNPNDLSNDFDPKFTAEFHQGLRNVGSELFNAEEGGSVQPAPALAATRTVSVRSSHQGSASVPVSNDRFEQYSAFAKRDELFSFLDTLGGSGVASGPPPGVEAKESVVSEQVLGPQREEPSNSPQYEDSLKKHATLLQSRIQACKDEEQAAQAEIEGLQTELNSGSLESSSETNEVKAKLETVERELQRQQRMLQNFEKEYMEKQNQLKMFQERSGSMKALISQKGVQSRLDQIKGEHR